MKKEGIQTRKRKPKSTSNQPPKIGMGGMLLINSLRVLILNKCAEFSYFPDKILPTIFPSQIHGVQPEIKMSVMHQPHNIAQPQDMHIGSSQQSSSAPEHYINVSPQSHSPHLPNPSNLNRHITTT